MQTWLATIYIVDHPNEQDHFTVEVLAETYEDAWFQLLSNYPAPAFIIPSVERREIN